VRRLAPTDEEHVGPALGGRLDHARMLPTVDGLDLRRAARGGTLAVYPRRIGAIPSDRVEGKQLRAAET
jgi:hypothetical protein